MIRIKTKIIIKGISPQGGTSKRWKLIKTFQWIRVRHSKGAMCRCKFSSSRSLSRTVRPSTTDALTDFWTTSSGVRKISRMKQGRSRAAAQWGSASIEWLERHNLSTREWMLAWFWISQWRTRDKLRWMITDRSLRLTLRSWTLTLIWLLSLSQYLFHLAKKLPKGTRFPQITLCHPMERRSDLIINSR
jgi:hypothetical protein